MQKESMALNFFLQKQTGKDLYLQTVTLGLTQSPKTSFQSRIPFQNPKASLSLH
jgi:hypothetical protein